MNVNHVDATAASKSIVDLSASKSSRARHDSFFDLITAPSSDGDATGLTRKRDEVPEGALASQVDEDDRPRSKTRTRQDADDDTASTAAPIVQPDGSSSEEAGLPAAILHHGGGELSESGDESYGDDAFYPFDVSYGIEGESAEADVSELRPDERGLQGKYEQELKRAAAAHQNDSSLSSSHSIPGRGPDGSSTVPLDGGLTPESSLELRAAGGAAADARPEDLPTPVLGPANDASSAPRESLAGQPPLVETHTSARGLADDPVGERTPGVNVKPSELADGSSQEGERQESGREGNDESSNPLLQRSRESSLKSDSQVAQLTGESPALVSERLATDGTSLSSGSALDSTELTQGQLPDNSSVGTPLTRLDSLTEATSTSLTSPAAAVASRGDAALRPSAKASAAEASSSSSELDPAQQRRLLQRVSRAFQAAQARGGDVRLRLSPPELGSLKLQLRIEEGALMANMTTETESARQVLLENLPVLKERLAEQGISVESFDVEVGEEGEPSLAEQRGERDSSEQSRIPESERRRQRSHAERQVEEQIEAERAADNIERDELGQLNGLNVVV